MMRRLLTFALPLAAASGLLIGSAAPASADVSRPRFGSSVPFQSGDSFQDSLRRVEATHGRMGVARIYQTVPTTSFLPSMGDRSAVVSFKLAPNRVLAGDYDAEFRKFFAAMPRSRPTWWSYYHEADVALQNHRLSNMTEFRAAYAHVARIARRAGNPQLKSTVILVCWTGNQKSGMSIKQFWPGADLTDVIAWDCYNSWSTEQGDYGSAAEQLAHVKAASAAVGKPWAVAEFGTQLIRRDGGASGRAAWVSAFSRYAYNNGAKFVCYFQTNSQGTDYRLLDTPSRTTWRNIVVDQRP
jgi:hypothetical protein